VHSILRSWKTFLRFANEFELIQADLSGALKLPRLPQTGRKGLRIGCGGDLRLFAGQEADWWIIRDLALITMLDVSGIRCKVW